MVSAALDALSDLQLTELVRAGRGGRVGVGGSTLTIEVAGQHVFVKLIPVTALEHAAGPGCTQNLFGLPTWYQYGVGEGSTGFSVWREVAAHQSASDWVRHEECDNFPLLYHWREIPHEQVGGMGIDPDGIDRAVRFWGQSQAIETRLRALARSRTVVALFLEHIPFVLRPWLSNQLNAGGRQAAAAVRLVDEQLSRIVEHLRSHGMSHFDAHFDNVLTDGERIYLSDFGLATSQDFQLDTIEREFVILTSDHDVAYGATVLVNTIASICVGFAGPGQRNDYLRGCHDSGLAPGLTGSIADTVIRHASVASIVNDFYWKLHDGDVTTAYPATSIATAIERAGMR